MPQDKAIKIRCKAHENVPIESFNPLQGELKEWVGDNYDKLKSAIIEYGFCVPMFAWKDRKGKIWTMDGHGRDIILKDMVTDGWTVPPLPTCWILAKSKKEAAEILLLINSRMREITEAGMQDFIERFNIDLEVIRDFTDFPEVDFDIPDFSNITQALQDGAFSEHLTNESPIFAVTFTFDKQFREVVDNVLNIKGKPYIADKIIEICEECNA